MRRKENPPGALRPRGPVGPARSRMSAPPPPSRMSPATWEAEAEKPAGTSRSFLLLGNKTGVRLAALLTVRWAALPDSLAAVTARTDVLRGTADRKPRPSLPCGRRVATGRAPASSASGGVREASGGPAGPPLARGPSRTWGREPRRGRAGVVVPGWTGSRRLSLLRPRWAADGPAGGRQSAPAPRV